jgi:hypothetical protein
MEKEIKKKVAEEVSKQEEKLLGNSKVSESKPTKRNEVCMGMQC